MPNSLLVGAVGILSLACAARTPTPVAGYLQRASLDTRDGRFELLEDERLTNATRPLVVAAYGQDPCEADAKRTKSDFCDSLKQIPLRPALVRSVGRGGDELGRLSLERATAELSRLQVSSRDSLPAMKVDLSAGIGSYSGPIVRILRWTGDAPAWVTVIDDSTQKSSALSFVTTAKTAWSIVPDTSDPEILMVACRPDLDGPSKSDREAAFAITYSRFYVAGGQWHRTDRRVSGYWENDGPFPARSLFP